MQIKHICVLNIGHTYLCPWHQIIRDKPDMNQITLGVHTGDRKLPFKPGNLLPGSSHGKHSSFCCLQKRIYCPIIDNSALVNNRYIFTDGFNIPYDMGRQYNNLILCQLGQ